MGGHRRSVGGRDTFPHVPRSLTTSPTGDLSATLVTTLDTPAGQERGKNDEITGCSGFSHLLLFRYSAPYFPVPYHCRTWPAHPRPTTARPMKQNSTWTAQHGSTEEPIRWARIYPGDDSQDFATPECMACWRVGIKFATFFR
ncbi:hypothetical protein B0T16DRAFT_203987 [Cercophora newfieldiana]|uniref:Uncharacterized protein n=1 Tax=Cercophora newfieldiana TaxID=92897 RepID=A0AA39XV96_9PEZI|nr:hypothetical protein B0T16DRAFT_203987 [Cercophora newfieldiana]